MTMLVASASAGAAPRPGLGEMPSRPVVLAKGRTCKQMSSCAEAVELWCGGYGRADADSDGIPCENVCQSKELVDELRARIGC